MRPGLLLFVALLAGACSHGGEEYEQALARMEALEVRVDAHFDAARAENDRILSPSAWDDPAVLERSVADAKAETAAAIRDQQARIAQEEAILALPALDHSSRTRVLFHLDLSAQRAKLTVLEITLEMYEALGREVETGDRAAYAELSGVYADGIRAANERYRDLDLERQRQQQADSPAEEREI